MKCIDLTGIIMTWALAVSVTTAADPPARQAEVRPAIGMWLTVWWTEDDQYRHWVNCHRFPSRGRYTAGDPQVVADHYRQFRDLGVDFIIMDDTNGRHADGGRIIDNIRAWFDFMDAKPPAERIPICIGGGGEMRSGGAPNQQKAADFYHEQWAQRPSYFLLDGKPLLLIDTDKNYGPGDFDDPRFAVRWAYNGDNHAAMARNRAWGWGSYYPMPILEESMSMWPGHRFPKFVEEQGRDPLEEPREGGRLYVRMWLRVLKARPRFVTIADWNNFEEETAIEDSYAWEDAYGHATPNLYTRITRAYARLRTGELVKGECYRDENQPEVYLFDGEKLVHQGAEPRRAAIILTPAGMLGEIRARLK
ncbi:MAG: hypothetical protein GXY55_20670 [Phycisphaerae bacterium]|nr:hypothetical protein [Phycisphaerae bacterium]